jgi:YHS domain-containing protein
MALVLAGTAAAANAANKVNVDSSGVILRGYDAVVYLKEGRPVKGRPEIKSSHLGATYLFASAANKQEFDKDPARYAPQYGGFCSYGSAWVFWVIREIREPSLFTMASFTFAET